MNMGRGLVAEIVLDRSSISMNGLVLNLEYGRGMRNGENGVSISMSDRIKLDGVRTKVFGNIGGINGEGLNINLFPNGDIGENGVKNSVNIDIWIYIYSKEKLFY